MLRSSFKFLVLLRPICPKVMKMYFQLIEVEHKYSRHEGGASYGFFVCFILLGRMVKANALSSSS